MATLFETIPSSFNMFQPDFSNFEFGQASSMNTTEHLLDHADPELPVASSSTPGNPVADATTPASEGSSRQSYLSGISMVRQSSGTSDSEDPTPSSSGGDFVPSGALDAQDEPEEAQRRPSQAAKLHAKGTKTRRRTTPEQLHVLEAHFATRPKPDVNLRKELATQLNMTPREVQVWFQNRRAKAKKLALRGESQQSASPKYDDEEDRSPRSTAAPPLPNTVPEQTSGLPAHYGQDYPPNVQPMMQYQIPQTASMPIPPPGGSTYPSYANQVQRPTFYQNSWQSQPYSMGMQYGGGSPLSSNSWLPPATTGASASQGISGLELPMLPHDRVPTSVDSGPSTGSSMFSDFTFGRRESVASVDSAYTDISEVGTVSGTMTPVSLDSLFPPANFDLSARRSSCPAEFIATFQTANLQHGLPESLSPAWQPDQGMMSTPQPVFPSPLPPQLLALGRRHSVAVNPTYSVPDMGTNGTSASGMQPTSAYPRRGSMASLLDPIAEHGHVMPPSPNGGVGAHRRGSAARKVRSQANMRQNLMRPASTWADGGTDGPTFDL